MEYETVFEISDGVLGSLMFLLRGLFFIAVGALLVKYRDKIAPGKSRLFINVFSWFTLCFAVLWTLLAGLFAGLPNLQLRSDYAAGDFMVVEGIVENFDPMPYQGHKSESFSVNGVRFEYSDFRVTSGFNNTASHGGPIREGLPVRISYIGNNILKLEIAKNANKRMQSDQVTRYASALAADAGR